MRTVHVDGTQSDARPHQIDEASEEKTDFHFSPARYGAGRTRDHPIIYTGAANNPRGTPSNTEPPHICKRVGTSLRRSLTLQQGANISQGATHPGLTVVGTAHGE